MENEKKYHITDKKTMLLFLGIFLSLLSLVILLNVGFPAHLLSFPFLYLFGFGTYPLFLFIYIAGVRLFFSRKFIKINNVFYNIAIIFFFFASLLLASLISYYLGAKSIVEGNVFISTFSTFQNVPGTYLYTKVLNIFSLSFPIAGGLIGNAFLSLTLKAGIGLSITFVVLFYIVSLVLFLYKTIAKHLNKINLKKTITEENKEIGIFETSDEIIYEKSDIENNKPLDKNEPLFEKDILEQSKSSHLEEIDLSDVLKDDFEVFDETKKEETNFHNLESINPEFEIFNTKSVNEDNTKAKQIKLDIDFNSEESHVTNQTNNVVNEASKTINNTPNNIHTAPSFSPMNNFNQPNNTNSSPNNSMANNNNNKQEGSIMNNLNAPKNDYNLPYLTEKPKERVKWLPPSHDLLEVYDTAEIREKNEEVAKVRMELINQVFKDFKVNISCTGYTIGPSVTRYHITCATGVSAKTIGKHLMDISIRLNGLKVRFVDIVEGESFSGIEVENVGISTVSFKDEITALKDVKKHPLNVSFGKSISGNVITADFNEFPHILVAGTTGSGKSIFVHSLILTLIMRVSPDDLKLVLVDPKKVEMRKYENEPHLLCPIINDANKAKATLDKLVEEMEDRFTLFGKSDGASNIEQYNEWAKENGMETIPYIIVVLDEYADLVDTCKEIAQPVVSIAQKARACGIHMLVATQRPSTNVINGVIKGNLPTRVALTSASITDSITIIGEGGAEKLAGKGDMLAQSPLLSRNGVVRLQGCFVQNKEISRVVGYLKEHYKPYFDEKFLNVEEAAKEKGNAAVFTGQVSHDMGEAAEEKYLFVKEWVMNQEYTSMSKIQRDCGVGFNRAGIFFKRLQEEGIVAMNSEGNKGSKVLIRDNFRDEDENIPSSDELISR